MISGHHEDFRMQELDYLKQYQEIVGMQEEG